MNKFNFLKSVRFWKLVIIGVLEALLAMAVIDTAGMEAMARLIEFVLGGSVVIRTVDRFSENIGK